MPKSQRSLATDIEGAEAIADLEGRVKMINTTIIPVVIHTHDINNH